MVLVDHAPAVALLDDVQDQLGAVAGGLPLVSLDGGCPTIPYTCAAGCTLGTAACPKSYLPYECL